MLEIKVVLEEDEIQELFEDNEIKFSKAKLKRIKQMISDADPDVKECLEEALKEFIAEMITDEWER